MIRKVRQTEASRLVLALQIEQRLLDLARNQRNGSPHRAVYVWPAWRKASPRLYRGLQSPPLGCLAHLAQARLIQKAHTLLRITLDPTLVITLF